MKPILLSALLVVIQSGAVLDRDALAGSWCLTRIDEGTLVRQPLETWTFATDNALVIDRPQDPIARREAVYNLRGSRIVTSLALTLEVRAFDGDRLVTEAKGERISFRRGACD